MKQNLQGAGRSLLSAWLRDYEPMMGFTPEFAQHIVQSISPNDRMYMNDPRGYFKWGIDAVTRIKAALTLTGKTKVASILDLPSGHGRVLRALAAAFPEASITACDIDRDAVDFCATTFGAIPVYSNEQARLIPLAGPFDLIWCGSLLTHLDAPRWREFLALFRSLLAPAGLLLFTTNGRRVIHPVTTGYLDFGLGRDAVSALIADWERTGFGYHDHTGQRNRGNSISSPSWVCDRVCEIPGLRIVTYTERGWNDHQDVVSCVRTNDTFAIEGSGLE